MNTTGDTQQCQGGDNEACFRPMHLLCGTCFYNYNYILRYENVAQDEPLFIKQLGAEGRIYLVVFACAEIKLSL